MGIYDRQYYRDDAQGFSLNRFLGGQSMVFILIGINVAVFFLDLILGGGGLRVNGAASRFLTLDIDHIQPWHWWRFLTYGFAHGSVSHILFNMLGLFFFGRAAEMVYGRTKFLWMYLTAIITGGVVWMLVANLVGGQGGGILGASGGVAAVVILFCLNFPNQKVLLWFVIAVPAWVVGILFLVGDIAGMFGANRQGVAYLVHLVGAAYAYLFFRTRWDLGELIPGVGTGASSFGELFKLPGFFKQKPNLRVHRPPQNQGDQKHQRLETKADEILKKLHEQGEASLSARERKVLEEYSRSIKQKNG